MTVNILDIRVVDGPTHGGLVTDGVVKHRYRIHYVGFRRCPLHHI